MFTGWVANTDFEWYSYLRDHGPWEEVNFWLPTDQNRFRAVPPGAPFFLRLKSPHNAIAGFGYFNRQLLPLPAWEVWSTFEQANGATDMRALTRRVARYSQHAEDPSGNQWIGSLILSVPVFFHPDEWVREPEGWAPNIVRG